MQVQAERIRRRALWLALAASPLAAAVVLGVVAFAQESGLLVPLVVVCALFGGVFTHQVWKDNPSPHRTAGIATVGAGALTWNGEPFLDLSELERVSYRVRHRSGAVMRFHRKGAVDLHLIVPDAQVARALMRDLGFGPDRSTATFGGLDPVCAIHPGFRFLIYLAIVGTIALLVGQPELISRAHRYQLTWYALLFGVPLFLLVRFAPTTAVVGADAVAIRWLGLSRVFPMEGMTSFEPEDRRTYEPKYRVSRFYAAVEVKTGRKLRRLGFGTSAEALEQRRQLVERVHEVLAARRRHVPSDTAFLARGGRDTPSWLLALRRLGSPAEGGMRTAPIPAERLWGVLGDDAARAVDRAVAAIAVGRATTPEQREQVRAAAQRVLDPALRRVLEGAIDARVDDRELGVALEALEAQEVDRARV